MSLTKFNWPLNDFNCATDVGHKLQQLKWPTTEQGRGRGDEWERIALADAEALLAN